MQFSVDDLRTPEGTERVLRQIEARLNAPVKVPSAPALDLNQIASAVAPLIQSSLQAPGSSPLNLTALLPSASGGVVIEDTHANRLTSYPAASYPVGTLFYETDRTVLYVIASSSGTNVWQYVAGIYYSSFATRPTDLNATGDLGFTLWISLHNHLLKWGGAAWVFVDTQGGYFVDAAVDPGLGWQLCDGTATTYLTISGADLAQTAFTTPDEVTAPSGVYHKSIAAYTGTINAANAGNMSGLTNSLTTTENSQVTGISVDAHPVVERLDDAGSGIFVFDDAADAGHTVNDPGHTHTHNSHQHTFGTIAVDATGQPRNLGVLRYFRR